MAWREWLPGKRCLAGRSIFTTSGYREIVVVHRLDQLLARTDPFDLTQALDRYVRAMSADRIQSVVIDARDRMGAYYRAEFVRLLAEYSGTRQIDANELSADRFAHIVRKAEGDDALRDAFARLLKSNLRAISVFGGTFTEGVLENVPSDRTVAIGEERPNLGMRAAVLGGVALALVLAGAVGEHVISNVRAQSVTSPLPPVAAPPVAAVMTTKPSAAPIAAATAGRASATSTPQPSPTRRKPRARNPCRRKPSRRRSRRAAGRCARANDGTAGPQ